MYVFAATRGEEIPIPFMGAPFIAYDGVRGFAIPDRRALGK